MPFGDDIGYGNEGWGPSIRLFLFFLPFAFLAGYYFDGEDPLRTKYPFSFFYDNWDCVYFHREGWFDKCLCFTELLREKDDIAELYAIGEARKARKKLAAWNRKYPEAPITITYEDIVIAKKGRVERGIMLKRYLREKEKKYGLPPNPFIEELTPEEFMERFVDKDR